MLCFALRVFAHLRLGLHYLVAPLIFALRFVALCCCPLLCFIFLFCHNPALRCVALCACAILCVALLFVTKMFFISALSYLVLLFVLNRPALLSPAQLSLAWSYLWLLFFPLFSFALLCSNLCFGSSISAGEPSLGGTREPDWEGCRENPCL